MSNAMSVSKSRWKGALLAAVATAVVSPLAASAQSLTLSLLANPMGGQSNLYKGYSNVYIDPFDTDTLYVYATVAGSQAPSASYVDGLQFAYFNVNAALTNAATANLGSITSATPSSLFGGGNFNGSSGNAGAGAQAGAITGGYTSTPSVAVGSTTVLSSVAKPRSSSDVFVSSPISTNSNIIISGNNVSFLVETLTYTPNSSAVLAHPSAPGAANTVQFNVSIPSIVSAPYVPANYFVGLSSVPTSGGSANYTTLTNSTASATNVKLTQSLPGDVNLDGTVNGADFTILVNNLNNQNNSGLNYGHPVYTLGDLNGDGVVNGADFTGLVNDFNNSLIPTTGAPLAVSTALIGAPVGSSAVPEPTSLALIGLVGAGLLGRKRASN